MFRMTFWILALALLWIPNAIALENSDLKAESATIELTPSESEMAELASAELAATESAVDQTNVDSAFADASLLPAAIIGCSALSCDASCRAQGYDYGVSLGSTCICRFYL